MLVAHKIDKMANSKDGNVKVAVTAIKKMKTADEVNAFISKDEDRKTILDAARERILELTQPESSMAEAPAQKSPAKKDGTRIEEFEQGQSLGRIHDRENWEKGL